MVNLKKKIKQIYRKRRIFWYYKNSKDPEILELINNLKIYGTRPFLGDFIKKYENFHTKVYREKGEGCFWVMHNGKKLFFSKDSYKQGVDIAYMKLNREQDINSPHRYIENYEDLNDCYVIDAGAAEASFSLDAVDRARKIYIFECNPAWKEPVEKTFENYGDKVEVIDKFVSNVDSNDSITIDTIFKRAIKENGFSYQKDKIFVKMDIEGMEEKAIRGMKKTLELAQHIQLSICAYHRQDDEETIRKYFPESEWEIKCSPSYMLFPYDENQKPPYFRHGVLRITKK